MAIAFRSDSGLVATGASPTVTKPAGVTDGDLLLTFWVSGDSVSITPPPAGWTLVASVIEGTTSRCRVYRKTASSEPASWDWTSSSNLYGGCLAYYDSVPIAVGPIGTFTGSSNTQITYPSLTVVTSNEMHVCVGGGYKSNAGAPTTPAGYNARIVSGSATWVATSADLAYASPGATGAQTCLIGGSGSPSTAAIDLLLWVPIASHHPLVRPVSRPRPLHHMQ